MNFLYYWTFLFLRRGLKLRRPLPAPARRLVWMVGLYDFTFALSSTFLNVYLFRGGDFEVVCRYNFAAFAAVAPAFVAGGWWSKLRDRRAPYQAGLVLHALLFLAVLLLGEDAARRAESLGILSGLAIGLYYLGQHALTFRAAPAQHRDAFFSYYLLFSSVFRVVAPGLAGTLVAALGEGPADATGYRVLFAATLAIYAYLAAQSFRFPPQRSREPYRLSEALRAHLAPALRPVLWAYGFWGLRNGVFFFLLGVLVYRATGSELSVGNYGALGNLAGVGAAWWLSRALAASNRSLWLTASVWVDFLSVGLLVWRIDAATLLLFTVAYAAANTGFRVTFSAYSFEIMERTLQERGMELEKLAVREFPLAVGRLAGLAAFLLGWRHFGETGMRLVLFFLGASHVAIGWIMTRTLRNFLRA